MDYIWSDSRWIYDDLWISDRFIPSHWWCMRDGFLAFLPASRLPTSRSHLPAPLPDHLPLIRLSSSIALVSRHSPLRALMTREEADGTTETAAWRFWTVNWTVTRRPFHSPVALAISSPTFFGDWGNKRDEIEIRGTLDCWVFLRSTAVFPLPPACSSLLAGSLSKRKVGKIWRQLDTN